MSIKIDEYMKEILRRENKKLSELKPYKTYELNQEENTLENKAVDLLQAKLDEIYELNQDENTLENETIAVLLSELIGHGKDINQIRQISQISKVLGQSLGLGIKYCDRLEQAAKVYDIGNIAIDKEIYKKEGQLSFKEYEMVKNHTLIGHNLLISLGFPATDLAAIIAAEHHEWWNGGGYPQHCKGTDINIASRIVAVADTVGALFTKRPGRKAWNYNQILEYITNRANIQFDNTVTDVFLINQEVIHEILLTDLESAPSSWYI